MIENGQRQSLSDVVKSSTLQTLREALNIAKAIESKCCEGIDSPPGTANALLDLGALSSATGQIIKRNGDIFKGAKLQAQATSEEEVKTSRKKSEEKKEGSFVVDLRRVIKITDQPKTFSDLLLSRISKELFLDKKTVAKKELLGIYEGFHIRKELKFLPNDSKTEFAREEAICFIEDGLRYRRKNIEDRTFSKSEIMILNTDLFPRGKIDEWSKIIGYEWYNHPVDQKEAYAIHGLKRLEDLEKRLKPPGQ